MSSEDKVIAILILVSIAITLLMIVLYFVAAFQCGKVASEKGYPGKKVLIIILCIFTPPLGYLLAIALPDRGRY